MSTQLAELQTWMREVITHPDGVAEGARTELARSQFESAPEFFDEVVTRSAKLSARQRLEIYQHGYFRRLLDCLEALLPVLRHALGAELFEQFALDYLQAKPSSSYTLAQLDDGFVAYLRDNRPDRDAPAEQREDWPDFIIDVARLERGIRVTFDGPGAERAALLDGEAIAGWSDEQVLNTVLQPVPCLSVMSFRFPVRAYLLAVRNGDDPAFPRPEQTWVAFNRRDYRVRLLDLEQPAFDLVQHMMTAAAAGQTSRTAGLVDHANDAEVAALRTRLVYLAEAGFFLHSDPEPTLSKGDQP